MAAVGFSTVACVGCVGTITVDFAIEAEVRRDAPQASTPGFRGTVYSQHPAAGAQSPFETLTYKDDVIEWVIGTGTMGFGGKVTNVSSSELCLLFDRAVVSSNFTSKESSLSASRFATFVDSHWKIEGSANPKKRSLFAPPPVCLPPRVAVTLIVSPDLKNIFPNETMFNVSWEEGRPLLVNDGVGNWFRIIVPLRRNGTFESLTMKLTAIDSRATVSYH